MHRRNFLQFAGGLIALSVIPLKINADDYRQLKPDVWEMHTLDDATKALYGVKEVIPSDQVKITVPKINSSGATVPVKFETTLEAKTIALFQDANPESAVAVYTMTKYDLKKYEAKIKMAKSGTIMVLVEGVDGKIYMTKAETEVALADAKGRRENMSRNKITAVKVKIEEGIATAKMAFSHPMLTYNQAKAKTGNREDANFITHIMGSIGKEIIVDISTSQFFSKNPIFKFQFKCDSFKIGKKLSGRELDNGVERKEFERGDLLTITAMDRKGNTYTNEVELTARQKRKA